MLANKARGLPGCASTSNQTLGLEIRGLPFIAASGWAAYHAVALYLEHRFSYRNAPWAAGRRPSGCGLTGRLCVSRACQSPGPTRSSERPCSVDMVSFLGVNFAAVDSAAHMLQRHWPLLLAAALGYLLASTFEPWLLDSFVLPWRRPVQDWLSRIGLAGVAPYYAFVNLEIPAFATGLLSGLVIGNFDPRRWWIMATAMCIGHDVIPIALLWAAVLFYISWQPPSFGQYLVFTAIDLGAFAVPLFMTSWLASRKARVRLARSASGLCASCGYDVRSTGTERCPECGRQASCSR